MFYLQNNQLFFVGALSKKVHDFAIFGTYQAPLILQSVNGIWLEIIITVKFTQHIGFDSATQAVTMIVLDPCREAFHD